MGGRALAEDTLEDGAFFVAMAVSIYTLEVAIRQLLLGFFVICDFRRLWQESELQFR